MIFKDLRSFLKYSLVCLLGIQISACSDFLHGKPKNNETIEHKTESLNCLKSVSTQFKIFLKSEASVKDIDESFACIDNILNEFQNRVEGRAEADSFTTDELFEIFNGYLKDAKLSRDTSGDFLLLKSAVLGGNAQKISKVEIGQLRAFLLVLKPEIKALIPYAKIFNFKKGEIIFSKSILRDAFSQLNLSLKNLLKVTKVTRSNYQFDDFKRLIIHLQVADGEKNDILDLASKVKNLLVGKYILQTDDDYQLFIDNLTEVLRLYALQVQGSVKFEISNSAAMSDSVDYVESWLNLLENSVQYKNQKVISLDTLDPLVSELTTQGVLSIDIKGSTLVDFYKMLVIRTFDSGRGGDVNKLTDLAHIHFVNIRREIAIFKLYLKFIDEVAPGDFRISVNEIQKKLRVFDAASVTGILKSFDKSDQSKILKAFAELKNEFLQDRPVIYRFSKMVIAGNQEIWDQNWQDLTRGLYTKMLARALMIGWGVSPVTNENPVGANSKEVSQSYLTEEALVQWYGEFKDFGIETRTFDPRSINSGSESFKQADLLTYAGDGDGHLSFYESIQYINMLISGGQTLTEISKGLAGAGCNLKEVDVFKWPWNNEDCAVQELQKNFKVYFSNLSWLNGYVEKLTPAQFKEFFGALMDVTRIDSRFTGIQLETGDIRSMSIILYYIESLFAVYDVDRNWTISTKEILASYPRFKNFARKYALDHASAQLADFNSTLGRAAYGCYSEEDLVRESFVFLIFEGRTPEKKDLSFLPCLPFFKKPLIDFSAKKEVDRKTIIKTFKILKAVLGSKHQ